MAKPGFRHHPKFLRVVDALKEPAPHVYGYIEFIWDAAYQRGNAIIGDATDVEIVAQYAPKDGRLCAALLEARLLDQLDDGQFAVHDLWDHAPNFVKSRMHKDEEKRISKTCEECQDGYVSIDPKSKFCSTQCRQRNWYHVKTIRRTFDADSDAPSSNCVAPPSNSDAVSTQFDAARRSSTAPTGAAHLCAPSNKPLNGAHDSEDP